MKFVAIYHAGIQKIHENKDIFLVPYFFSKEFWVDSSLVWHFLDKEVGEGVLRKERVNLIETWCLWGWDRYSNGINLMIIKYLFKQSKKIDILHLNHLIISNIIYTFIYKTINPKWKVFIKMDMNSNIDKSKFLKVKKGPLSKILNKFIYYITNFILSKIDCISVETQRGYDILTSYSDKFTQKTVIMPNGYNSDILESLFPTVLSFKEKENYMITVWRVGSSQKNLPMLMEVLSKIDFKDWKCFIIWPYENEGVENMVNDFYLKHPNLKNKVVFTWAIYDYSELYDFYNKSKIFLLTSIFEGFPLVFPDAIYFNNRIISTKVSSIEDITKNGKFWDIIAQWDIESFVKILNEYISNYVYLESRSKGIHERAKNYFSWASVIIKPGEKLKLC